MYGTPNEMNAASHWLVLYAFLYKFYKLLQSSIIPFSAPHWNDDDSTKMYDIASYPAGSPRI